MVLDGDAVRVVVVVRLVMVITENEEGLETPYQLQVFFSHLFVGLTWRVAETAGWQAGLAASYLSVCWDVWQSKRFFFSFWLFVNLCFGGSVGARPDSCPSCYQFGFYFVLCIY